MRISLPYDPPNWNRYINIERANRNAASALKKREKQLVEKHCSGLVYDEGYPVEVIVRPHFKTRQKDLDNTRIKGLLDGLVSCGVLEDDNLRHMQKLVYKPVFDDMELIEIEIRPMRGDGQ